MLPYTQTVMVRGRTTNKRLNQTVQKTMSKHGLARLISRAPVLPFSDYTTMTSSTAIILYVFLFFLIFRTVKITHDNQRFVTSNYGKFKRIAGPGIVILLPFIDEQCLRLTVGDSGKLLSEDSAEFSSVSFPVTVNGQVLPGESVIVLKFENQNVIVGPNPKKARTYKCSKCGHENRL